MFNFQFYLGEIAFTSLAMITVISARLRRKCETSYDKKRNIYIKKYVRFDENVEIRYFETPVKLYIQLKDVVIDTYSANPKKYPGVIDKMDPIGHSVQSIKMLSNYYDIHLIYDDYEEVWWAREYFGNEILSNLRMCPKADGILISTVPNEFSGELVKFGNGTGWPKIKERLLKKINS